MIEVKKLEDSNIYLTLNEKETSDLLEGYVRVMKIYNNNSSSEPLLTITLDSDLSLNTVRYNEYVINVDLEEGEYSYIVSDLEETVELEQGLLLVTVDKTNGDVIYNSNNNGEDIYFE